MGIAKKMEPYTSVAIIKLEDGVETVIGEACTTISLLIIFLKRGKIVPDSELVPTVQRTRNTKGMTMSH